MASILKLIGRWAFPVILCALIVGVMYYAINHQATEEEEGYQEIKGYDGDGKILIVIK